MEKVAIEKSDNWKKIQEMAVTAGLEPGDLGEVIQAWAAKVKEKIVGGVILLKAGGDCTIEWLSVLKEFQGQGIGSKLVEVAIREARERGFKKVVISMQIPEFFKRFGFVYARMADLSKDFFCYRCQRYNKSCFPVAMVLDLTKPQEGIKIEEVKDFPLLAKLAAEMGQEVDNGITRRIVKGWFALKGKKIVGGIGIFRWDGSYTLEYSFATEDKELVQENLMKQVLLFGQKEGIDKVYYIRGAPDHLFPIRKFGFKEIHWRNLPPVYRELSELICDKCPEEIKSVCNPVAMVLEFGQPPRYVTASPSKFQPRRKGRRNASNH
jgi:N-acetylglutamate synthase-like GNAT family acetyltransferase